MSKESKNQQDVSGDETRAADTSSTNPEPVDTPESVGDACKKELEQWKVQCLRVTADFQNYKRRMEKEQAAISEHAQERVLFDLLNVIDDFDRAFKERQSAQLPEELKGWFAGFELIYKSFQKLLQQHEVQKIEKMTDFDPHLHEAVAQIDSADHQSGQIVEVLQKGYMFKDHVLRPAKVVVAK